MNEEHEWVERTCLESPDHNPARLLERLMDDPRCPAFGPIHHLLVGAALLTCQRNVTGGSDETLAAQLAELEVRSGSVPGAACARWGVCGAAASCGMAFAIICGNEPLKREHWSDGQSLVAGILGEIADVGAPRCCKRDSRIAVRFASRRFNELLGCGLEEGAAVSGCAVAEENSVCLGATCPFHG